MRKRKVVYPPPKTATKGGASAPRPNGPASTAVTINLQAMTGRTDIRQGVRVRITAGLYEGEVGVVESVVGGVIPAAVVRTAAGQARRLRTVDLAPATNAGASSDNEATA